MAQGFACEYWRCLLHALSPLSAAKMLLMSPWAKLPTHQAQDSPQCGFSQEGTTQDVYSAPRHFPGAFLGTTAFPVPPFLWAPEQSCCSVQQLSQRLQLPSVTPRPRAPLCSHAACPRHETTAQPGHLNPHAKGADCTNPTSWKMILPLLTVSSPVLLGLHSHWKSAMQAIRLWPPGPKVWVLRSALLRVMGQWPCSPAQPWFLLPFLVIHRQDAPPWPRTLLASF